MKNKLMFILFLAPLVLKACYPYDGKAYSPLYKYRMFPIKIHEISEYGFSNDVDFTAKFLVQKYFVSNDNYYSFVERDSGVYHVMTNQSNKIFTFSDTNGVKYLDANSVLVAYLSNDFLFVIDTNSTIIYQIDVDPTNFIFCMANGTNKLFAFGEEKLVVVKTTYNGDPTNFMRYHGHHDIRVVDIDNAKTNTVEDVHGLISFSRRNKYLFFTYRTLNYDYPTSGVLGYFDMERGTAVPIGDLDYEKQDDILQPFSDNVIGITKDMKRFFVWEESTCGAAECYLPLNKPHIDGRYVRDFSEKISEIDISSLGLSE